MLCKNMPGFPAICMVTLVFLSACSTIQKIDISEQNVYVVSDLVDSPERLTGIEQAMQRGETVVFRANAGL